MTISLGYITCEEFVQFLHNIPEDQLIVITVAMGFPDDSFPANEVVSERRPVGEIATYRGFDE